MSQAVDITPAALDRKAASAYLALSVRTFERLVREKSIPQPRQLAGRRVAWLRIELDQWLTARPISEQLPPENTGAPKPHNKRRSAAANDPAIRSAKTAAQKAA